MKYKEALKRLDKLNEKQSRLMLKCIAQKTSEKPTPGSVIFMHALLIAEDTE